MKTVETYCSECQRPFYYQQRTKYRITCSKACKRVRDTRIEFGNRKLRQAKRLGLR